MAARETPESRGCAVDIRLFFLTIVLSMSGSFFAGVWIVPPQTIVDSFSSLNSMPQHAPRSLELAKADLFTSLDHSPSGQHLLVDIEGIEAAFLDSEERLSAAMVQTVEEAGLTLLSYHCHKLHPAGISCVGVLLESHISFHTWPEEGVITLDLFTCGPNPLLPVVPVIERLFGVGENAKAKWSHELRGFRSMEEKKKNYMDNFSDLSWWVLSPLEIPAKKMVYSNLTRYQRIDIWELVEVEDTPSYQDGIDKRIPDGDARWQTLDLVTPDKILFLDGSMQSMYSSETTYHEALVHPVMFAHPSPAQVGIIGGGEGATLREVLKHNTVEHVTMIEIDEELINIVREYLPKMSDCSELVGRADNCFDDEIVNVVNDNGLKWFVDRYGPEPTQSAPAMPFDVILVDALDPEDEVPFNTDLYVDGDFVNAIMSSLSDYGVILIQIGTAPDIMEPKADMGMYRVREKLFRMFEGHPSVAAMHVYEEVRSGFLEPHSFLVVCKHASCRSRWYDRSDAVDYEISDRVLQTKSGHGSLKYYDGITQYLYQTTPMAWETVYCRREPTPFECAYRKLDFAKPVHDFSLDEERSSFRIESKQDEQGRVIGSVFAKVDIPKGSYVMPEHLSKSMLVDERSIERLQSSTKMGSPPHGHIESFIDEHSHAYQTEGMESRYLEVGASILIRNVDSPEEANVGHWVPLHPSGKRPTFSPVYDRHRMTFEVLMVATKDIPAGAELTRFK